MRKTVNCFFLFFLLFYSQVSWAQSTMSPLDWEVMATLPPADGQVEQLGLAGAFSGVHNDALIIAGGANFPEGLPWEGGQKKWYDDIFILAKAENGKKDWIKTKVKLPRPLAYGVSIPTENGLLCIGGCDSQECVSDVFLLQWNNISRKLEIKWMPSLPVPLGFMSGALVEETVYIAGGQEDMKIGNSKTYFFALDLSSFFSFSEKEYEQLAQNSETTKWETLPSWPGAARILPVAVAQANGLNNCFYLFSGRNVQEGQKTEYLSDSYYFNPTTQKWKALNATPKQQCLMGATAVAQGASHLFIFGGDNAMMAKEQDAIQKKINVEQQAILNSKENASVEQSHFREIERLENQREQLLINHPGFSKKVWSYYTITDSWTLLDKWPFQSVVTSNALKWNDDIIITSGEIRPGVRTPKVYAISPNTQTIAFGWLNYLVLLVYFAGLVWMGVYFSKRQKSTEDYFKGGGRIPWWAAGLSIFGTVLSAISFMAIPAKTFATDWSYLMYNFSPFFIAPVIITLFLPFYHRLNITSAYEYLERRFNLTTRLLGSVSFMIYQLGRIAIILYLPAIALNVVTGFDILLCIAVMGLVSVVYTMMGGIEGVIWTDVVQVVVLMGGALVCVFLLLGNIDGGIAGVMDLAKAENKFNILDFTLDWKEPGFWVVLLGGIFSNIVFYGTDQTVVQRYITATDFKDAKKSVWTNAILVLPATLLFFGIGTLLFVYFKNAPEELQAGLEANDAVFPWYIVSHLPQGVSGLLIAGVFAASMSSLSSSMNSVATAYTTDFHQRFKWKGSGLKVARYSTLIVGILGTLFAMLMATSDIKSLWDEFLRVVGLITGGLGGLFVLGMISKRANAKGALVGLAASVIIQFWVAATEPVHILLYTTTGFLSCLIVGYVSSLFFPKEEGKEGLTI